MISQWAALAGIGVLLAGALVLALIDVAFDYFSKISIRTYDEESWKTEYLTRSLEDPMSFLLPLRIGLQGAFTGVAILVTMLFLNSPSPQPLLMAFATMLAVYVIFREVVPNILGRKNPERLLLTLLPGFRAYVRFVTPLEPSALGVSCESSSPRGPKKSRLPMRTCRPSSRRERTKGFSKATRERWCSPSSTWET